MGSLKIIVFFLLFLLGIVFQSCAGVPKYIRNAFSYCYNDKDTGIDFLIDINGYYLILYPDTISVNRGGMFNVNIERIADTSEISFMFYRNGLFKFGVEDMNMNRLNPDSITKELKGGNIPLFLQEIAKNPNGKETKWFYYGEWGSYIVSGDTIKVQYIDKPWSLSATYGREQWFKIIDRNTLIPINTMPLSTDQSDWRNYESYKSVRDEQAKYPAVFVPVPVKPNPDDAWILKEKWFWCNEQDWKNYMERIKKKK